MIKNMYNFTLLQIYVRGKKYDLRKGGGINHKYDFKCNTVYTVDPWIKIYPAPLHRLCFLNHKVIHPLPPRVQITVFRN